MAEPTPAAVSVYDSVPLPLGDSVYIRVIKIRPGAENAGIACDFGILDVDNGSLYDLDTALPSAGRSQYTALSYMWGKTVANRKIELNGTRFPVRKNLWDFLKQARTNGFRGYLWIDALCIDQAQVGERNHQVGLMGKIYSHARDVIVWLGHNHKQVESAMHAIARVLSLHDTSSLSWSLTVHCRGIGRLFGLGYWSRAWIVQEYVLARKIEVWSGKIKISGDVLAWLYKHKRQWIDGSEYEYPAMRILFSRLDRLERLASGESRQTSVEGYDEFRQLIGRFGDHILCDDPRDRLYALLSLLSPEGREQLSITPDYTKSTLEIFKQIVEFARISEETHIRSEYIFRWVFSVTQQMLRLSDEEVATHLHKAS